MHSVLRVPLPYRLAATALALSATPWAAQAQTAETLATNDSQAAWRQCRTQPDAAARLTCFDQWAEQHTQNFPVDSIGPLPAPEATAKLQPPAALQTAASDEPPASIGGCRDASFSETSRFWELEDGTDCGKFSFRGYRPTSVMVSAGSNMNYAPKSGNPLNSTTTSQDYNKQEMRIQLSVRTKLASNLLTREDSPMRDSLWVGYTSQSSWQLFTPGLSRPFRNTDHEPEVIYVYPTTAQLPFGWRWRYTGAGLVHQSNGQSDPLSRSWNRLYVMTGLELDNRFTVQAKLWKRISESAEEDNNPNIQNYIGRSELKVGWNVNKANWLGVTARGSLNGTGKGSGRVEWMHTLGEGWMGGKSNLRLHANLFSGYGDSLIDYNFKRTVFSVGLSLMDF